MEHPKYNEIQQELQNLWDNEITVTKFCLGHNDKPAVFRGIDEDVNLLLDMGYRRYGKDEFLLKSLNK